MRSDLVQVRDEEKGGEEAVLRDDRRQMRCKGGELRYEGGGVRE